VKINNLDTYCEQVGRRGKDCDDDVTFLGGGGGCDIMVPGLNSPQPNVSGQCF
jgi:hypothetical protein